MTKTRPWSPIQPASLRAELCLGPADPHQRYSADVRFKLVCPSTTEVWSQPENEGFDRAGIVRQLGALQSVGHTYEQIDGDALNDDQRSKYYGDAVTAVLSAGNVYSIRTVFGSHAHGGGGHLGTGVPALLVYSDDGEAVGVYPHRLSDGTYITIRQYLDSLA